MLEMHNWIKSEQELRINLGEDIKQKFEQKSKMENEQNKDSK